MVVATKRKARKARRGGTNASTGRSLVPRDPPREGIRRLFSLLRREDSGQDLIEYALLTAIIGLTSAVLYTTVRTTMSDSYKDANANVQDVWQPLPPGGM